MAEERPRTAKPFWNAAQLWHGPEVVRRRLVARAGRKNCCREKPVVAVVYKLCVAAGLVASLALIGITAALGVTPWAYMQRPIVQARFADAGRHLRHRDRRDAEGHAQRRPARSRLNTGSSIVVAYSPSSARRVPALWRSERSMSRPIRSRPFKVNVGTAHLQAVGTRFNVRVMPQNLGDDDRSGRRSEGALRTAEAAGRRRPCAGRR